MSKLRDDVQLVGAIVGLLIATVTAIYWAWQFVTAPMAGMVTGYERGMTAFAIGGFSAGAYGVLWAGGEKIVTHTRYGPGIGGLPKGWEAVILSLATTLPLAVLPLLGQFVLSKQIVPLVPHFFASVAMVVAAAGGHVLLYGTKKPEFSGLRNIIFPPRTKSADWGTAILMESVYATVHFFSTIFVYQLFVQMPAISFETLWAALYKTVLSGSIFFFGASATVTVIALSDRKWLTNPAWVGVRGMANGTILMFAFTFGILM